MMKITYRVKWGLLLEQFYDGDETSITTFSILKEKVRLGCHCDKRLLESLSSYVDLINLKLASLQMV